jgi:hypothetical protein
MKRHETTHAVTFEIAETRVGTAAAFQPRIRLDAIVFVDIGRPRRSPIDALQVLADAFGTARRSTAGDRRHRSGGGPTMAVPSPIEPGDRSDEAA